jgi:hypothetical protein
MENKRWRKYLLFFTTDTNNNKIVLICTKKIINDETTNYSDYIFITITINAQAPCEYSSNVTDSTHLQSYKRVFDE